MHNDSKSRPKMVTQPSIILEPSKEQEQTKSIVEPELPLEFLTEFDDLVEKANKTENIVKVLQLIIKDLPRKNKEDDPHYKLYSDFFIEI